jgi:methionyl-tRNA formyltransferase
MLKIGYFADSRWGIEAFKRILADPSLKISFVCLRYVNPCPELKDLATEHSIQCITTSDINTAQFNEQFIRNKCDLLVSMSFDQIFKKDLLQRTPFGAINCHAGKLPFYRGRNILNWALINDETEFGITVHFIDEGIDTGDIILQRTFPICDSDDYGTLLNVACFECGSVLYDAITMIQKNSFRRMHQNTIHPFGFYCTQRKDGDEIIHWNQSSRDVFNFIRALCRPGPRAKSFNDSTPIFFNKAHLIENAPIYKGIPGAVVGKDKDALYIKTLDSVIKIIEWECSRKLKIGDRLQ